MLNKVQIIGNLGADPEVRTFQNGGKVANLSVATSQKWKDKSTGEVRERTEWHLIAIFAEHACRYAEQYLRKGAKVYVEGRLETRKWKDLSGGDRYTTEVVVRPYSGTVQGLDRAPSGQGQQGGNSGGGSTGHSEYSGGDGGQTSQQYGDIDDEIPF